MRKIKEVLRLKFDVGLGLRQIARSCSIGLGTAHEYLQRAEAAKITWPLGPEWDDDRLERALFGGPPRSRPTVLAMPDFADLHRQRPAKSCSWIGREQRSRSMIRVVVRCSRRIYSSPCWEQVPTPTPKQLPMNS